MKKALLMVNMGGPSSTDKIEEYLKAIFNDSAILSLPTLIRKPLASFVQITDVHIIDAASPARAPWSAIEPPDAFKSRSERADSSSSRLG